MAKYRLIKQRIIALKDGSTVEWPGDVFDEAELAPSVGVAALLKRKIVEPVGDAPAKQTKEVAASPVTKGHGKG